MNRILLVVNALLALVLAIRVASPGHVVRAGEKPVAAPAWSAADLRLLPVKAEREGDGRWRSLLLDLGADVAALPLPGQAQDLGLRLEPTADFAAWWQSPRTLRLHVPGGLQPARRYTLHWSRGMTATDGRTLAAGTQIAIATPTVEVDSVVVDRGDERIDPAAAAVTLLVAFDQRIGLPAARRHLLVRDPRAPTTDLPATIELRPDGDREVFAVRVTTDAAPTALDVVVEPGLTPLGGELGTTAKLARRVVLYEPLELRSVQARADRIDVRFNTAVPLPLADQVQVVPKVPFQVLPRHDGVRLVGQFAPGSVLGIEFARGFPGRGQAVLAQPMRHSVLVPDLPAEVAFAQHGSVLSARAEPTLAVRGVNVRELRLRLRRIYTNNVVRALQEPDERTLAPAPTHVLPIAARRNESWRQVVDLRPLLGERPRGLFQAELSSDEEGWPSTRLLQITDLGVTVRAGRDAAVVQVVGIADGRPLGNASVKLLTPTNQALAAATTDWEGIARLRWSISDDDRSAWLVHVQAGDDEAFVGLEDHGVELADETLGGRAWLREGCEAWAWPTRGIVRPGERIEVVGLIRDVRGHAAVDEAIVCEFTHGGRVHGTSRLRTSGSGLVTAMWSLRADAPSGAWQARFRRGDDGPVIGEAGFEVAAFVPNRLEAAFVRIEPLRLGGKAIVRVRANWLDGAAAAARPVRLRTRLLAGTFAPAGLAGFAFANGGDTPPGELEAVTAVLDERGEAQLELELPAPAAQQVLQAVFSLEVIDPSGRPVRAAATAPVLRPDFQLGVRAGAQSAQVCVVDVDGRPLPTPAAVTVRLEQRRWEWRYQAGNAGQWRWRTEVHKDVLGEWPLALVDGRGEQALPALPAEGWHVVVITCGDVVTEQVVGRAPASPDRLRVTASAAPVAGGVAIVHVDAPAAGRGLVTVETDTVLAATTVALARGDNTIRVPIPSGLLLPNVHVVVTLTRPAMQSRAGEGPAWLIGGTAVLLPRPDLGTDLALSLPAEVLPETELAIGITAVGASSAVVAVVDEGVLAVTGHQNPDPRSFVLARRRLAVEGADLLAFLLDDMKFLVGSKTGGGDGDDDAAMMLAGSINTRIRPLALCETVALDTGGSARVRLRLPRYEGRVRVMVVAAGPAVFASAAQDVVVKAPLGVQVALPRMVAPGDRFFVPVTLRNDTGAPGMAVITTTAGAGLALVGEAARAVPLAVGEVASVDIGVVAAVDGAAARDLTFAVALGDHQRKLGESVEVRARMVPAEATIAIELARGVDLTLAEGWAADGLHGELLADRSPDRQLRPALEALLRFPYGCCEQTASQGLALLACQALLPRLWPADDPRLPQAPGLVQAAVDRLFALQTHVGGFAWWSPDDDAWDFGTVHALDFLLAAREAGAVLPEAALQLAVDRLQRLVERADDLSVRCHAIEVLGRAGRAVQPRLDWLCTQAVLREDRARLAMALMRLGEARRAAALLHPEDAPAPVAREQRGMLRSPLREQALWFRARLAVDPTDTELPLLALALQRQLAWPQRLSTQELGQGLRALADYYRMQPRPTGPVNVPGSIDGVLLPAPANGRIPLLVRPGSRLLVQDGGEGFGLVTLRGMRPATAAAQAGTVQLRREVVDLDSGAVVTQFVRGRVYEVRIHGTSEQAFENVAFVDLLPGGLEPEAPPTGVVDDRTEGPLQDAGRELTPHVDRRDDRVLLFQVDRTPAGAFVCRHRVRAVFPGSYTWPALSGQSMYDPTLSITGGADLAIEVRP